MKIRNPKHLFTSHVDVIKEAGKLLKNFANAFAPMVKKTGRADALNPPEPSVDIERLPFFTHCRNACLKVMAKGSKNIISCLQIADTEYKQSLAKIVDSGLLTSLQKRLTNIREKGDQGLQTIRLNFGQEYNMLKDKKKVKTKELDNLKHDLSEEKSHKLRGPCWLAGMLIIGVVAGDLGLIVDVFEILGAGFREKYMIGISVALSTVLSGVGSVHFLRRKKLGWVHILGAIGCLLLVGSVYFTIGKIRLDLIAEAQNAGVRYSSLTAIDFLALNLIFFVAVILAHWIIWPTPEAFAEHASFKKVEVEITVKKQELKEVSNQIDSHPKRLNDAEKEHLDEVEKSTNEVILEMKGHIKQLDNRQTIFNSLLGSALKFYDELNCFYKEMMALYLSTLNKYRADNTYSYINETLPDLKNPFMDYNFIHINFQRLYNEDNTIDFVTNTEKIYR